MFKTTCLVYGSLDTESPAVEANEISIITYTPEVALKLLAKWNIENKNVYIPVGVEAVTAIPTKSVYMANLIEKYNIKTYPYYPLHGASVDVLVLEEMPEEVIKEIVSQFMKSELYSHPNLTATELVESVSYEFSPFSDDWLDQETHWVWDIAVDESI